MDNSLLTHTPIETNASAVPTSEQGEETSQRDTHPLAIVLLLIIFVPAALYLMYKQKRYHRWFAYLLWIEAGLSIIFFAILAIMILPHLLSLYQNLNIPYPKINLYIAVIVLGTVSITQIIVGILLFRKAKEPGFSYKKLLYTAIALLIFNMLFGGYGVFSSLISIVMPIYNITNSIK